MKKTVLVLAIAVVVMGTMSVAFADASGGPAGIFASEKGITVEEAYEMKVEKGVSFGELAKEEGVYDEFVAAALLRKEAILEALVEEGRLTQEEADEILANFETCDGTRIQNLKNSGLFGQNARDGLGCGIRAQDGEGFGERQGGGFGQGNGQMRRGGRN